MQYKVGDIVSVCPTYRGFNSQFPKVNGIIKHIGISALVEFAGWGCGHDGKTGAIGDGWFIPQYYLKSVIQLPDETPPAAPEAPTEPASVTLYPSDLIILKHLKSRKSISVMEAFVSYGCARLAPRIHNLRLAGHVIDTTYHRDEVGHRYCRYTLKEAA